MCERHLRFEEERTVCGTSKWARLGNDRSLGTFPVAARWARLGNDRSLGTFPVAAVPHKAQDGQDEAQEGQDEAQHGQDKAQDGQDKAQDGLLRGPLHDACSGIISGRGCPDYVVKTNGIISSETKIILL